MEIVEGMKHDLRSSPDLSTMNSTAGLFNGLRRQYCFEVVASQKHDSTNVFCSCLCSFFVFINVPNVP